MTRRVRRLGRTPEEIEAYLAARAAADRCFERAWMEVFSRDHLDPALAVIAEIWDRDIDAIVETALARHVRSTVRIPVSIRRLPRARARARRARAVRVGGRRKPTGDPDGPARARRSKGGAR